MTILECTKVTTEGFKKVIGLKKLKTLICGNNSKIDPGVVFSCVSQMPSLRKLSIKGKNNL